MTRPWTYPVGTLVIVQHDVVLENGRVAHPAGAVGVVVRMPVDAGQEYRVKFNDGFEAALSHDEIIGLTEYQRDQTRPDTAPWTSTDLSSRIIYRCIIGSRAYGLESEYSDTDRRGIYLPPAELHWSLYGYPEQLENEATQEAYWELQKFILLALKANPNVLECLYSPCVELATPLAQELLAMRDAFLSKLVFQTYSGYVASQFKKMQTDLRNQGQVKWKHVMHLIRLLISGIDVLREGAVLVEVGEHREPLLAIKRGEVAFAEADRWRQALQSELELAFQQTKLPDRPDYERANAFLIDARRRALAKELP